MGDILNCVVLLVLAYLAAVFAISKSRYEEATPAFARLLLPHRNLEGFWRVLYVHVTFAGIALAATTPEHLRTPDWGYYAVIGLILFNLAAAFLSQYNLDEETTTPMSAERRPIVRNMGILVVGVYVLSMAFVVTGVYLKATSTEGTGKHKITVVELGPTWLFVLGGVIICLIAMWMIVSKYNIAWQRATQSRSWLAIANRIRSRMEDLPQTDGDDVWIPWMDRTEALFRGMGGLPGVDLARKSRILRNSLTTTERTNRRAVATEFLESVAQEIEAKATL